MCKLSAFIQGYNDVILILMWQSPFVDCEDCAIYMTLMIKLKSIVQRG